VQPSFEKGISGGNSILSNGRPQHEVVVSPVQERGLWGKKAHKKVQDRWFLSALWDQSGTVGESRKRLESRNLSRKKENKDAREVTISCSDRYPLLPDNPGPPKPSDWQDSLVQRSMPIIPL